MFHLQKTLSDFEIFGFDIFILNSDFHISFEIIDSGGVVPYVVVAIHLVPTSIQYSCKIQQSVFWTRTRNQKCLFVNSCDILK